MGHLNFILVQHAICIWVCCEFQNEDTFFQSLNFYLIKVQKKIQENFSDNSYYFFLK